MELLVVIIGICLIVIIHLIGEISILKKNNKFTSSRLNDEMKRNSKLIEYIASGG